MQPLGLKRDQYLSYVDTLSTSHDFELDVDVLNMEERVVGTLNGRFLDGQVNIQREGFIKRTATLSFYDPDHSLHFDSDSPFAGAVFADRMIRVRHSVVVPGGVGRVWATMFVGPVTGASRTGDVLNVACQDKTILAVEGHVPKTVKKGRNAVAAIREIMEERTGEARFRFPAGTKARLTKSYSVGWKEEASPWRVCQKIANSINMELLYASDGALILRRPPKHVALDLTAVTGEVNAEFDMSTVRNYVRVTGEKKKTVGTEAGPKKKKVKHEDFTVGALPPREHPMSPRRLGRNGVARYLPLLIDDPSIRKEKTAEQRAERELAKVLPMSVKVSFAGVPFFHLDYGDLVRATTNLGTITLPLREASIPIGLAGDAEYGNQKIVSRPRRR